MTPSLADAARRLKPQRSSKCPGARLLPRLIVMTDRTRMADPDAVLGPLPRGTLIILRDYDAPDRAGLARLWRAAARRYRMDLLIGADPDLARRVKAAGVHWPEKRVPQSRTHGFKWITAAAHNLSAVRRAQRAGADLILISPVFETPSHRGAKPLGLLGFRRLARGVRAAALGGIDARTARYPVQPRPAAFAAIGAFIPAPVLPDGGPGPRIG